MRTRSLIVEAATVALVVAVSAGGRAQGAEPAAPQLPTKPVATSPGCPDLSVKLTLQTSLVNGRGQVALHSKVCNVGNRDFAAPPQPAMRAEFHVTTWHPPKTPAQEGNTNVFAGPIPVATQIPIGQCVPYEERYAFDGVLRWLEPAVRPVLAAGERLAHKEFAFNLVYPPAGYTAKASDDCSTTNNAVGVTVTYVDKQ
jgi:hypothetical protein